MKESVFICNVCTNEYLPFANCVNLINDNEITSYRNNLISNSQALPTNSNTNIYKCFEKKGMHFVHANARSLFYKLSEFRLLSEKSKAAVIGVSETWFTSSHTDREVSIEGYNIIRRDSLFIYKRRPNIQN